MNMVTASATTKVVNVCTNIGALAMFTWQGTVLWALAPVLALCNMGGAFLGAHMALKRGSPCPFRPGFPGFAVVTPEVASERSGHPRADTPRVSAYRIGAERPSASSRVKRTRSTTWPAGSALKRLCR